MLIRCRICFKPATKLVLRILNLIVLAINSPSFLHLHPFCEAGGKQKVGAGTRAFSSRSSNFASEMSLLLRFFIFRYFFQRVHALPVVEKRSFCSIIVLLLNSTFCKCTAYRYISLARKPNGRAYFSAFFM